MITESINEATKPNPRLQMLGWPRGVVEGRQELGKATSP
jgi:hypothetical protein